MTPPSWTSCADVAPDTSLSLLIATEEGGELLGGVPFRLFPPGHFGSCHSKDYWWMPLPKEGWNFILNTQPPENTQVLIRGLAYPHGEIAVLIAGQWWDEGGTEFTPYTTATYLDVNQWCRLPDTIPACINKSRRLGSTWRALQKGID